MSGLVFLAFIMMLITSVVHLSGLHSKSSIRQIAHNFMLLTNIITLMALLHIYRETKNIYVLTPLLVAFVNYYYFGHNCTECRKGDGAWWGFMNGMILSILGMQK